MMQIELFCNRNPMLGRYAEVLTIDDIKFSLDKNLLPKLNESCFKTLSKVMEAAAKMEVSTLLGSVPIGFQANFDTPEGQEAIYATYKNIYENFVGVKRAAHILKDMKFPVRWTGI